MITRDSDPSTDAILSRGAKRSGEGGRFGGLGIGRRRDGGGVGSFGLAERRPCWA